MKTLIAFLKYISLAAFLLTLDACQKEDPLPNPGFRITVTDKANKPISGAKVDWEWIASPASQVAPYSKNGYTDSEGIYPNDNVGDHIGEYSIKVTAIGYKIEDKKLTVSPNAVTSLTVKLEIEPPIELIPSSITFSDNENEKPVHITNKSLESSITLGDIVIPQTDQWVKLTNPPTIPPNGTKDITVTVDRKGRGFGSYNSTITFNYSYNGQPFRSELNVYMLIANPQAPSIVINEPTGATQTSADLISTVTNLGGSPVTDRGIYWSESPDPQSTTAQKKSAGPGVIGSFQSTINGLKSGTKYYVRAYAVNANGIGLSEVKGFTTSVNQTPPSLVLDEATNVTLNSAALSATVTNNGGSAVTRQGFCWNKTGDPKYTENQITANADGNGKFTANMTGLPQGVDYYVRAFAINTLGDTQPGYSPVIHFKTQASATPAKLITGAATTITETTANVQGNVTELGSSAIVQHGFCWSPKNVLPDIDNADKNQLGQKINTDPISANLSNLKKGTLYYIRVYATSSDGKTVYGNVQTFVTKEQGLVIFYPFNGDASDASYNGNNAIATAKLTEDKKGSSQSAYDLSSGTIVVQNQTVGRFMGDFTYSFLIKINASAFRGSPKVLLSKGYKDGCFGFDSKTWGGFMIYTDPTNSSLKLWVAGSDGTDDVTLTEGGIISDSWKHIVITKTGTSVKFYLNGSPIKTTPPVTHSTIGGYLTNNSPTYEGNLILSGFSREAANCKDLPGRIIASIDNFRLYSYGLSDDDVKDLYNREN